MYDFKNNNLPMPLMNTFTVNADIHEHNTRQLYDVHIPNPKTDLVKRSYIYKAPDYWLKIFFFTKMSKSINIFKSKLSNELISQY